LNQFDDCLYRSLFLRLAPWHRIAVIPQSVPPMKPVRALVCPPQWLLRPREHRRARPAQLRCIQRVAARLLYFPLSRPRGHSHPLHFGGPQRHDQPHPIIRSHIRINQEFSWHPSPLQSRLAPSRGFQPALPLLCVLCAPLSSLRNSSLFLCFSLATRRSCRRSISNLRELSSLLP